MCRLDLCILNILSVGEEDVKGGGTQGRSRGSHHCHQRGGQDVVQAIRPAATAGRYSLLRVRAARHHLVRSCVHYDGMVWFTCFEWSLGLCGDGPTEQLA